MSFHHSARTVVHHPFRLTTGEGEALACDARAPGVAVAAPLPVVVFVHGFRASKDWGAFPYLCEQLAIGGLCVVSFNFSHTGIQANGATRARVASVARSAVSREIDELAEVVDAVANGTLPLPFSTARESIGLLGHSRGGGIAIIAAAEDPRVRCVAVLSSVASFDRFSARQKREWRQAGRLVFKGVRTAPPVQIDVGFLNDLEANAARLDIGRATTNLHRPLLIVHGEQDLVVRIDEARRLAACGNPSLTTFTRVPSTNHTFGATHPFVGPSESLHNAISATSDFFHRHLAQRDHY